MLYFENARSENRSLRCILDESSLLELGHTKDLGEDLSWQIESILWRSQGAGGEGDNRGWDGWTASPTQWTWVSVNSRSWWWIGRPGMLQSMGLHRVRHDWATVLNWTELNLRNDIPLKGCCWTIRRRDSWPPEETNSIQCQRRGWITHSFCVIKFY